MEKTLNYSFLIPGADGLDLVNPDLFRTPFGQIDTTLKAKYDEVMALLNGSGNTIKNATDVGLAATASWALGTFQGCWRGGMACVRVEIKRITTAYSFGTTDGNVTNTAIATFDKVKGKNFLPLFPQCGLTSAHSGSMHSSYVDPNGQFVIASGVPNATVGINEFIVMFGLYPIAF